jgi:hypothetical protein
MSKHSARKKKLFDFSATCTVCPTYFNAHTHTHTHTHREHNDAEPG